MGWSNPEIVVTLSLGILLLAGFVAWERRAPEPMLPLRRFGSRPFVAVIVTAFLMTGAFFGAAFLVSQYFQFVLGDSPLTAGLRLLPWTATPMLVGLVAGLLSDRIVQRPVMVVGMLLQGVGLGWFALLATTSAGYAQLILPLLVAGISNSMVLPRGGCRPHGSPLLIAAEHTRRRMAEEMAVEQGLA